MPTEPPHPPSRTVLVVDDDASIRESVTEVLSAEGYRVRQAVDGVDALAELEALAGGCVLLLDLGMPRMTGQQVLAELGRRGAAGRLPVVVMSANTGREQLDFPQVVAVLRKPFELDELLRWVQVCAGVFTPETH